MSPSVKLGLMTLVSAAAAIPHYGGHSKFHHKPSGATGSGAPYPSGGWARNSTALPFGTASGASAKTTTIQETLFSTTTEYRTVYATPATAVSQASVGAANVKTGAAVCGGQETVYVTATNKVTVTVAELPSSSIYTPASSVAEAVSSFVPGPGYSVASSAAPAKVSSSAMPVYSAQKPSSVVISVTIPHKGESTAAPVATSSAYSAPPYSAAPVSSAAPVKSSAAPASSVAPKPSDTPTYSGSKRGLAYNDPSLCSTFGGGKYGFAYNWASNQYGGKLPEGLQYVPMMHNPSQETAEVFLKNVETAVKGGSKAVMGFNEPDHAAQANMSPESACAAWKNYLEPIVSAHPEVTIIGPSVTNGPAPMGLDWLSRFQKSCPEATWHAANIHFYDIYDDKVVDRFISHCEEAAKTFGKPVWVTEFGLNPGSATQEQAADFLSKVMKYMDGSNNVKGYAYFMVGTGENQLNSGNGLSPVGKVYAS
ncbi:glycosyl hydrolase catalytic core-domain-containing protein [Clohesyomyces aquaticus]|uniref:Glycosyl hydrolase catalytic core-domain-containing protein n=1 Tax=Clohesyomyces aquaticus TaxID=1231657 RepID=A0A1Y1ZQY0_9PLEO|nr:glycosyl hydrolase catalytic core-domain-containing protein [Clohesyomyces aquaticus]